MARLDLKSIPEEGGVCGDGILVGIEVRYFKDELTFSSRHLILLFFNPLDSLRSSSN